MIQYEKDIHNLKDALEETKEEERKKTEELEKRAVRLNFFLNDCQCFQEKWKLVGGFLLSLLSQSQTNSFSFKKRLR